MCPPLPALTSHLQCWHLSSHLSSALSVSSLSSSHLSLTRTTLQVDELLEEAVEALPKELPFQQVDRIEYMRHEEEEGA